MEKNKRIKSLFSVIVIGFILFLFASCSNSDSSKEKDFDDYAWDAKICAMEIVKQNLKAPSTADFPAPSLMSASNSYGDTWVVEGYVDAENSFGAMIRENFTVTLTLTDSGYTNGSVTFD